MTDNLLTLAVAAAIVLAALAMLAAIALIAVRAVRRRDDETTDRQMAELARLQAETTVRIEGMRDIWPAARPSCTARSTSGSTR